MLYQVSTSIRILLQLPLKSSLKIFRHLLIIIIIFLLLYLLVRAFGPVTVTASETLQNPKATVEVKELIVDISKDGGSKPNLVVKLHILPIYVHIGEPRISCDQSPNLNTGETFSAGQASFPMMEKYSAPFSCEELSLSCEFGHNRYFFFLIQLTFSFILYSTSCKSSHVGH